MKHTKLFLIIVLISSINVFPWGDEGHKLVTKLAFKQLSAKVKIFNKYSDYVVTHSVDPDNRKRDDKSEPPKHFIDIDFYQEFMVGKFPHSKEELQKKYHDTTILENGILPWTTFDTYNKLVQAFKAKNKKDIELYLSDLAHYVGDGHQPMHTVLNYDGKKTGQKGLHARYEIMMLDPHVKAIENAFNPKDLVYVKNREKFVFDYITSTNLVSGLVFEADNLSFKYAGARDGEEYYRLMWFRTGEFTTDAVYEAANSLACLIYSAWIDAGKPKI